MKTNQFANERRRFGNEFKSLLAQRQDSERDEFRQFI